MMTSPQSVGPKGWEKFQVASQIRKIGILRVLVELWKKYGDFVKIKIPFGGPHLILVFHPEDVMAVLQKQAAKFIKGKAADPFRLIIGRGLSLMEHEPWRNRRRVLQPHFHQRQIEAYLPDMHATLHDHFNRWRAANKADGDHKLNLVQLMSQLTHDIVCRTLLGTNLGDKNIPLEDAWAIALSFIVQRANLLIKFPLWLPLPSHRKFQRSMKFVRDTVTEVVQIQLRDTSQKNSHTLLAKMISLRETEDKKFRMSDIDLRDQVLDFLFAGHETTANSMSWIVHSLLENPEKLAKLQQELALNPLSSPPTWPELQKLKYLRQVIYEGLRLYPPVSMFVRESLEEVTLPTGGILEAGSVIILSPFAMHRRKDLWGDNCEEFFPERFAGEAGEKIGPPHFLSFGGGGRACIGEHFAIHEMMMVLAEMFSAIEFSLVAGEQTEMFFNGTLRPRPLHVYLRFR